MFFSWAQAPALQNQKPWPWCGISGSLHDLERQKFSTNQIKKKNPQKPHHSQQRTHPTIHLFQNRFHQSYNLVNYFHSPPRGLSKCSLLFLSLPLLLAEVKILSGIHLSWTSFSCLIYSQLHETTDFTHSEKINDIFNLKWSLTHIDKSCKRQARCH